MPDMPDYWEALAVLLVLGLFGGLVSLVRTIGEEPMRVKHFAVGLGIALLLPLSVYYAVELIRPAPKEDLHAVQVEALDHRIKAAKTEPAKESLRAQKTALSGHFKERKKRHDQVLFAIGYAVGISSIILGMLTAVRGVSIGALFGGLLTLTYACFSYWDTMADWLRFSSLVAALALLAALGGWRFGAEGSEDPARNDRPVAAGGDDVRHPGSQGEARSGATSEPGRRAPAG